MASKRAQITMSREAVEAFIDDERTLRSSRSQRRHATPRRNVARTAPRRAGVRDIRQVAEGHERPARPAPHGATRAGETDEELKGITIYGRARIVDDRNEVLKFGELLYARYWSGCERSRS